MCFLFSSFFKINIKLLKFFMLSLTSFSLFAAPHFTWEPNKRDVVTFSQALYDIYIQCPDDKTLMQYIGHLGIKKGGYLKINAEQFYDLEKRVGNKIKATSKMHAGGAAANTVVGIASLGGQSGFIGLIAEDEFGNRFSEDIKKMGVFNELVSTPKKTEGTGVVYSFITPDGDRTMIAYPGLSLQMKKSQIDFSQLLKYKIVFSDAYSWDRDLSTENLINIFKFAKTNKLMTAFGLANEFYIKRYREELLAFLSNVDIVFGNAAEVTALFEIKDLKKAIELLRKKVKIAVITDGKNGAYVATPDRVLFIPLQNKSIKPLDTTGAGDMFAAGVLYGLTHNYSLQESGLLGALMAEEIVQKVGGRPEIKMDSLLKKIPINKEEQTIPTKKNGNL